MLAVIERHKAPDGRAVKPVQECTGRGSDGSLLRALYRAEPLPSRLALHLHDTRPRPVSVYELATRDHGIGDRTSLGRAMRSVFEYVVVDRRG
jgi:hypothetical protein